MNRIEKTGALAAIVLAGCRAATEAEPAREPPPVVMNPISVERKPEHDDLTEIDHLNTLNKALSTENDEYYRLGREYRRKALERHWEKYGITPPPEVLEKL